MFCNPNMVLAMRNSCTICFAPNGVHEQNSRSYHKSKYMIEYVYCNLGFSPSKQEISRKFSVKDYMDTTYTVEQYGTSCRIWPRQTPGLTWGTGSMRRRDNLVMLPTQPGLSCEDEEISSSVQETKEGPVLSMSEQTSYPWSNRTISDSRDSGSTSCLSEDVLKVHFLEERDEEILSRRILSLCRSNKVRSALEIYMSVELSGLQPSAHACNSLLSCLTRNGSILTVLKIFEKMKEKEIASSHTYSLILKAVARDKDCDSALKLFTKLEGEGIAKRCFDPIVYNTIISICGRADNWVPMERLWRKLKENGHIGTKVTYSVLVCTFVRCGQNELALDAFHEMIQNQIKPGEDILKAILGACAKEGKWEIALSVFQQMLKAGSEPNAIVYNALINCLGKSGKVELAFRVHKLMISSGHEADMYTWSALLSALYKGAQYVDVLQLFESIKRGKRSELNGRLYNMALMSCQRLGLWDRSLQLLWEMEESGISISTVSYNHVIGACESARKPKVALQVYQHMVHEKSEPDMFTYLSLIRACVWGSLWAEAEEILNSVAPNASIYNTLIQGMCLKGQIMLAKELYRKMQSCGLKPDGKTRAFMLQHLAKGSN